MDKSQGAAAKRPWRWRRKKPMRRGPWRKQGREAKPRKRLPVISRKRARERELYLTVTQPTYLGKHRLCECGCGAKANQVHHKAGREGTLLNDERHFMAVDQDTHDRIRDHPRWAREHGYLYEVDHITREIRRR